MPYKCFFDMSADGKPLGRIVMDVSRLHVLVHGMVMHGMGRRAWQVGWGLSILERVHEAKLHVARVLFCYLLMSIG